MQVRKLSVTTYYFALSLALFSHSSGASNAKGPFSEGPIPLGATDSCELDLLNGLAPNVSFTANVVSAEVVDVPIETVKNETGAHRKFRLRSIKTVGEKRFSEKEIFGDQADLIIGIDVTGNTQGHTYMIINGTRMDGRMFRAPHTEVEKDWTLSPGLIIRYKNLPKANRDALFAWLDSDEVVKSWTCVETACKILYERAGFENPPRRNFWFPSKLLAHLARTGLTGDDGQRIFPEIYTINRDVQKIWANLPDLKAVPSFIFKVLFDPYTWQGLSKKNKGKLETSRD